MINQRSSASVWVASCAGLGYFPVAPGTAGSAAGLLVVAALGRLPVAQPWLSACLGAFLVVCFVVGVWTATAGERFFGCVDPRQVVIDEVAGQMATFLVWPDAPWKWLLAGFVLFRVFDILKPFPARRAEQLPGGWGIMLDDLAASGYSLAALWGLKGLSS